MSQETQVPPKTEISLDALRLSQAYQLGDPIAEYRVGFTPLRTVGGLLLALIFGLLTAVFIVLKEPLLAIIFTVAITLLGLGSIVWYLVLPMRYRSWRAVVCDGGLAYVREEASDAFRWDQIEVVWHQVIKQRFSGISAGTFHKYKVRRMDGAEVIFDDKFRGVEELGTTIGREVTRCLWPQMLIAFHAGQVIPFGPLSINIAGIIHGREMVRWDQIKSIGVQDGLITVQKEGLTSYWVSIASSQVPNIVTFLDLIEYAAQMQR